MKISLYFLLSVLIFSSCGKTHEEKSSEIAVDSLPYLIAYNVFAPDSVAEDNYEIFIMDMNGGNKSNLTNHPDVAWTYLSSDSTIFFVSDRDTSNRIVFLYEMDKEGNNVSRITNLRMRDSWMGVRRNGSELILIPHSSIDSIFYIINRKGDIIGKVKPEIDYMSNPTFSPDGQQIAFVGKNKKSKREEGYWEEIFVCNDDGSQTIQLTHYPENDTTAEWFAYKAGPPRWHPTEEFISFQSKRNGKYSLYAVTPDGKKEWKLTELEQNEGWHSWSPDGKWLAIEVFDTAQTQFGIGLMHWETKEFKILTDSSYKYQQAPVFLEK